MLLSKIFSYFSATFSLFFLILCWPVLTAAETLTLDLGSGSFSSRILLMIALLSVLSLAPSLLVMLTSFTRITIVLSFLRHALGLGQSPPNSVMVSLALFLTLFTMSDTFQKAYEEGVSPYLAEKVNEEEAIEKVVSPFHSFMMAHVGKKELGLLMDIAKLPVVASPDATPLRVLMPAFMLSELKKAFEIGFLLFLPFIVIDLIVASVTMSMGMMMLPPTLLSLPFKVIFFVLADGWSLLAGSLVRSYAT